MFKGIAIVPKGMNHWFGERKDSGSKNGLSEDLFSEPLSDGATRPQRHFSLADIRAATNDFDTRLLIGWGRLKKVYKGCMDGETSIVMINKIDALSLYHWEEVRANIKLELEWS
ncbi:Receptor-like protein kinase FERONIA [Camellia lanceoleosa]|uniref:Receptor-like protein kinase FERONIA n=1 Tax=Camellia lanceoleosa TaxID=1840588 RepID=A0ACC0HCM5_9ERIC|nr:Receptor-like protein kinase FERONIA [Camellia lanceoleosa]